MNPSPKEIESIRTAVNAIHLIGKNCLDELETLFYIKELNEGDHFSYENQSLLEFGLVLEGVLRIYYLTENGEEWNKHFLQQNDFIASSLSPYNPSVTNIQSLTNTRLLCVSYEKLMMLSNKYTEISVFLQKLTFLYLEQKQHREIRLLSNEATENYLYFIEEFPNLENSIPHYHIARYLGISPTQLSRIRKKLNLH